MRDPSTEALLQALRAAYGNRFSFYGTSPDEEHGFGFRIDGIHATFSAITEDGALPFGRYDVQIESYPPGEYVYRDELAVSDLLVLVELFARPHEEWPNWEQPSFD